MTLPHRAITADVRELRHERERQAVVVRVCWEETIASLDRFKREERALRTLDAEIEDAAELAALARTADTVTRAQGQPARAKE